MRENKFRAWDKGVKCFYYFSLKDLWAEGCEAQLSELDDPEHLALNTDYPYEEEDQYTGKNDKNDKEIYGGDIVVADYKKRSVFKEKAVVIFYGNGWCIDMSPYYSHAREGWCVSISDECDMEIIGNIHENPELLKE